MRLLAEESREGTLEVLMTMPMNELQFIVGKFLAAWTYFTVLLVLTLVYHFIMLTIGMPDLGATFGAYVGRVALRRRGAGDLHDLVGNHRRPDRRGILGRGDRAGALPCRLRHLVDFVALTLGNFIRELGLQAHYNATMAVGIIRAEDILYFVFMMIGALFITTRIVETRRWRS